MFYASYFEEQLYQDETTKHESKLVFLPQAYHVFAGEGLMTNLETKKFQHLNTSNPQKLKKNRIIQHPNTSNP